MMQKKTKLLVMALTCVGALGVASSSMAADTVSAATAAPTVSTQPATPALTPAGQPAATPAKQKAATPVKAAPALTPAQRLAKALDITPAQLPQWDAYMKAKADLDKPVMLKFPPATSVQESLEQRLKIQEARLQPQIQLVKTRAALIKVLSPAQRYGLDMSEVGRGIGPVLLNPTMPVFHAVSWSVECPAYQGQ